MQVHETRALIFLAVRMASREKPANLDQVSAVSYDIKNAGPTDAMRQSAIQYLVTRKLVDKKSDGFSLSTNGELLYSHTESIINLYDKLRLLEKRFQSMNDAKQVVIRRADNSYSMLVWGATLLTAPVLFMLWNHTGRNNADLSAFVTLYLYFVIFGLALSLPTYLIYRFSILGLVRRGLPNMAVKLISVLIVSICLLATLMILNGNVNLFVNKDFLGILFPYLIPVIVFSFVFRLNPKPAVA